MSDVKLPIYAHTDAIIAAVRNHRVVVVEGAPGTGKTTQLPRMLYQAGLVPKCMGVTQPRRIAAVSVAWRIASEEAVPIGDRVGYAIRFDDATGPRTQMKIMTDGILLQEARTDPLLRAYDIIMVDEAHERSLNIDFALGLLHQVLSRRDDLKVIISSATLYPGTFQKFFAPVAGEVPVVRIDTRTYPLSVEHRPVGSGHPEKVLAGLSEAVLELHHREGPGHILVFLPGEGLIQKLDLALRTAGVEPAAIILPLYGRLTRSEQERIFETFGDRRKIILATNLAETSITIDGVRFVVDAGFAKLPWHNARTGVTTLREMPISQASATQRAGRAGRTGPGRVLRLYDAKSFGERPEFTPEEIARVDLSEAVLRLIDLGVRDVEAFPFPTQPPPGKLRAALATLTALGAIDRERGLTPVGRQMVPFPLSPPLARMVVEAAMRFPDAIHDVLLVGAYLSVRSPFLYPTGEEAAAKTAQKRLIDPRGDIMTAVNTVARWRGAADKAEFCRAHYLDADTMAFIERAHAQLCDIAHTGGVAVKPGAAAPDHVIRCVAAGFADKVLLRCGPTFETPTGVRCAIHPGSSTFGQQHRLMVAAELFHSGRTYAVNVSPIKPEWLVEFHPEAARRWRIAPKSGRRGATASSGTAGPSAAPAVPAAPAQLRLGRISLQVNQSRRRPMVAIPLEVVPTLVAEAAPLPDACERWKAQVHGEDGIWLRGGLPQVLAQLAWIPWPAGQPRLPRGLPLGSLLEVDRNLHVLQRFAPQLLSAVAGAGTPQPGWLALVGNGVGGYWFDVVPDFAEAVSLTDEALDALRDALGSDWHADLAALRRRCSDYVQRLR